MKYFELKIPPVIIFLACFFIMLWIHSLKTIFIIVLPMPIVVFGLCFAVAGYFGLGGIIEFRKAKTSVHPVEINKATVVVATGVYRLTRNPMYFGLLLLLFGFGYWQQDLLSLMICFCFIFYMNQFQIIPEEKHLTLKFGNDYTEYKKRVRRWI